MTFATMTLPPVQPRSDHASEISSLLISLCAQAPFENHDGVAEVDWPRLMELARQHNVLPLVYRGLKQARGLSVATEVMHEWSSLYRANAARAIQLTHALFDFLDRFAKAGISAIPFKGPMLAAAAYGDLSLRQAGDLDLLVRRDDIV